MNSSAEIFLCLTKKLNYSLYPNFNTLMYINTLKLVFNLWCFYISCVTESLVWGCQGVRGGGVYYKMDALRGVLHWGWVVTLGNTVLAFTLEKLLEFLFYYWISSLSSSWKLTKYTLKFTEIYWSSEFEWQRTLLLVYRGYRNVTLD